MVTAFTGTESPRARPASWGGLVVRPAARAASVGAFLGLLAPEAVEQPLIRLGADSDGGYLVPDDLEGIRYAISPGVAREVSFDLDLAARGIEVVMLDASVAGPPVGHERFTFHPLFLDSYESERTTTLQALVDALPADAELLLEMDIEGGEWRVIHSMPRAVQERFRIMVIELHPMMDAAHRSRLPDFEAAIRKLLVTHRVVHIHQNNASRMHSLAGHGIAGAVEITLHRRDRSAARPGVPVVLPNPLDRPNLPFLPDHRIPKIWRRGGAGGAEA